MPNIGATPIDPDEPVGALRFLVGDTDGTPLDPEVVGSPDYAQWSDSALGVALAAQHGNQLRAAGTLYLQLAAAFSISGRSIKTDDLAIDTKGRGRDLHEVAQSFFDEATAADNSAASDFFQIVPFTRRRGRSGCACRPEGAPRPLTCGNC